MILASDVRWRKQSWYLDESSHWESDCLCPLLAQHQQLLDTVHWPTGALFCESYVLLIISTARGTVLLWSWSPVVPLTSRDWERSVWIDSLLWPGVIGHLLSPTSVLTYACGSTKKGWRRAGRETSVYILNADCPIIGWVHISFPRVIMTVVSRTAESRFDNVV